MFFFSVELWLLPQVRIGDSQKVIVFQVWSWVKFHSYMTVWQYGYVHVFYIGESLK